MGPIRQTSFVSSVRHCCCCGCPERGRRMPSKSSGKRKRLERRPTIHPKNKYAESPPDFGLLASLYPSFQPYVFYSRDGSPRIDWTDFNATRELTRVLLLHDHGLNWWIPDGQLCPTVPNRSNYIHWIEDLLASDIIPKNQSDADVVRGFDIGTGANCIYPLLGASLLGWSFVGSDVTDVALQWAERNVKSNPHISDLIEIRKARGCQETLSTEESPDFISVNGASQTSTNRSVIKEAESSFTSAADTNNHHSRPPVLLGLVGADEKFDFCMCNPPFFETMEEASLNPKTACGGTLEEMVCPGGEKAFITSIIEDSVVLKDSFRWYSSMVGRKTNLKFLTSKLWEVGATIVKTTEFVQGKTCRWGLAWSFIPPVRKLTTPQVAEKSILTFMLEGLERQYSAIHVLQSIESFFHVTGASCKLNSSSFYVDINASKEQCDALLNESKHLDAPDGCNPLEHISNGSSNRHIPLNNLSFRIMVFQQIPGTLLVKGSLQHKDNMVSATGVLSSIMQQLEQILKQKFCRTKASFNKIV